MSRASEVLVIGAGPSGLAAAASLVKNRIGVHLVDRFGIAGGAYSRMYDPLVLSSPASYLALPGLPLPSQEPYLSAGEYASYLSAYSRHNALDIDPQSVTRVERDGAGYQVTLEAESRPRRYRCVVVATGMCDSPVIPEGVEITEPGAESRPIVLHSKEWQGSHRYGADRVLIVGSGMRGVELAEECAWAGAEVVMSVRQRVKTYKRQLFGIDLRHVTFPLLRRAPRFLVRGLCRAGWRFPGIDNGFRKLVAEGRIVLRGSLSGLAGGLVEFRDGEPSWAPDLVVLATGYRFETPFLSSRPPRAQPGYPLVESSESPQLPNLFFLGIPCAFGADSQFLHGMARDARRVAATITRRLEA